MLRTLLLAAALFAFPASALAHSCPAEMAAIDAALETASLSEDDKAKVMELRARGEAEHQAGNHDASMATLGEAKALLGI
ncbi:hypothetical protein [Nitratireductor thuwali]|uniref:Uncharacterized protein n=1 Tax=Nitratireductor thuwali TaxID=2267699 RepID=A0ABY5MLK6_9HYPH|nr:hypothetical protein NTH_01986 [Nitratireductor thuwali]